VLAASGILAREVIARCQELAGFSEDVGSTRRTFLSPPMRDCHREIATWMEPLGAKVTVDAAGNLHGLYPANAANAPQLLIGSHLDTVPDAGAYDGVLGVAVAIAVLEGLGARRLPFAIEVIGFSEEEGVRFGAPFIGSRALVGGLDEDLLGRRDRQGVSVRRAIENFGLNPEEIAQAAIKDNTLAYLEFHIEQGPVLEKLGQPLASVEAIAGQSRMQFVFLGRANHAGTTPMNLRYDAIAGAAEWISSVEVSAQNIAGLVATVGQIEAKPGVANVIAAEARLSLDVRHRSDQVRGKAVVELTHRAEEIAQRRGLSLEIRTLMDQPSVLMDPYLVGQIEAAIRKCGCEVHRMVSGAGHDAMVLAAKIPAAMIFLRTVDGVSHDPAESVKVEDVAKAIECGVALLDQLAASPEFQKRMHRA